MPYLHHILSAFLVLLLAATPCVKLPAMAGVTGNAAIGSLAECRHDCPPVVKTRLTDEIRLIHGTADGNPAAVINGQNDVCGYNFRNPSLTRCEATAAFDVDLIQLCRLLI